MRAFLKLLGFYFFGFLLCLSVLTLPGCALFQKSLTADQLVIQELTAAGIQAGCTTQACYDARAAHVAALATTLKSVTPGMAVTDVTALLQKALTSLKLTPEETAPLTAFVSGIGTYLVNKYGSGALAQSAITDIQTIAGWIAAEAALY